MYLDPRLIAKWCRRADLLHVLSLMEPLLLCSFEGAELTFNGDIDQDVTVVRQYELTTICTPPCRSKHPTDGPERLSLRLQM